MANTDRPCGFKPFGQLLRVNPYRSASAIYPGDAVKLDGGAANTTDLQARVALATAGDALVGIALTYASAAGAEVLVADHPDQLFTVQADGSDFDANSDLGQTVNLEATAGDSTYKISRMELDSSEVGTTTYPFRLMQFLRRTKNELGEFSVVVVGINNHQYKGSTGTATV